MLTQKLQRDFRSRTLEYNIKPTGAAAEDDAAKDDAAKQLWLDLDECYVPLLRFCGCLSFFVMLAALYGATAEIAFRLEVWEQASHVVEHAVNQSIARTFPDYP